MVLGMVAEANADQSFWCKNGIIHVGDSIPLVRKKCIVIEKERVEQSETQFWTVTGQFERDAVLRIERIGITMFSKP
jgi:hypothetical protein